MSEDFFEKLLEQDPYIQQQRALGFAEGKAFARGRAEGEMQALQRVLVNIVIARFPTLLDLAQQRAAQTKTPEALHQVILWAVTAPDEHIARFILTPPAT